LSIFDIFKKKKNTEQGYYRIPKRRVQWGRGDYTLKNSEIIFSAVSRLANALSCMPVQLYHGIKPVHDDLNELVKNSPNPNMTSCNFFKTWETCRDTDGNGYVLKVVDEYLNPVRLDILNPDRVEPALSEEKKELYYIVHTDEGDLTIHNFYIAHTRFISGNGIRGVNPISVLHDTLRYADKIQSLNAAQIEKGISNAVVLEAPANLGETPRKKLVSQFMETYYETGGNILMLESGVTAKSLNMSPVDAKLFEVEKLNRAKVATVYNIPPHLLGDYSNTSFSTMEQQMLEFLTLTMTPIVRMYEQELDRLLLTPEKRKQGYHFKFDMAACLRADTATKTDANFKAVRSAWKTPNEIREEEGKEGMLGGDQLFISKDMIPLVMAAKGSEKR
jgi:HK97 family phage portal protein